MKALLLVISVLAIVGLGWVLYPRSSKILHVTDFSQPIHAEVHAPVLPFRSGAMLVLFEGTLEANAEIEIVSNRHRDRHLIELKAGKVSGRYGGAEAWVDDLSVDVTSQQTQHADLQIGLFCGGGITKEYFEWYKCLPDK